MGGLWTSTFHPHGEFASDWVRLHAGRHRVGVTDPRTIHAYLLHPQGDPRILTLDSLEDAVDFQQRFASEDYRGNYPDLDVDWEKVKREFDVVHLTGNGERLTRGSFQANMCGWDVESAVWLHPVFRMDPYTEPLRRPKPLYEVLCPPCRETDR